MMMVYSNVDYSVLDRPEVLRALFHPRPEAANMGSAGTGINLHIPVEHDWQVGARFHVENSACPNILFFNYNYT